MKQYGPDLPFQREAINAVVDLFEGEEICQTNFTIMPLAYDPQMPLPTMENDLGIGNRLRLLPEDLDGIPVDHPQHRHDVGIRRNHLSTPADADCSDNYHNEKHCVLHSHS
jgi:hypothetical protein